METIEVRPRNRTATAQIVPAAEAVRPLVEVRRSQVALAAEIREREDALTKANAEAVELQDKYLRLKGDRAELLRKIDRDLSGQSFLRDRIAALEGQIEHLWSAGGEPRDHVQELEWRSALLERVPDWLKRRREILDMVEAEIAAFEKKHLK